MFTVFSRSDGVETLSAETRARAILLHATFDDARPQCLLCNPDPKRRYVMKRVKVIGELDKPRWKYANSTVTNELCEHCLEEFQVFGRLAAYQEHEQQKLNDRRARAYRRMVEEPCSVCGHHFETEEDLDRQHCTFCTTAFDHETLLAYAIDHSGSIAFFRTTGGDLVLRLTLEEVPMDFVAEDGFTPRFWTKVRRTIREKLPHLPLSRSESQAEAWSEWRDRRLLGLDD